MIKYVFKDKACEEAVRSFCEKMGIKDFDYRVKHDLDQHFPRVSLYLDGQSEDETPIFTLSADLFDAVEVYNPDGWNDPKIEPPCFF